MLALVCDSTNILREGESPSERDVAKMLTWLIGNAKGRVVVTTFASNVARLRSAAEAGLAAGRQVCILGRAIERVVAVARECGMLDGLPPFLGMDAFERVPRERILALATGSQGEPRAALARMAGDEHPTAELTAGDTVIFSSRTIPGNEKAVGKIVNAFVTAGVEVVTDRTALVHVSGHPRRAEMAKMYAWVRPTIAVPAHGEPLHLSEHADFARAQGVPQVLRAFNGDLVRLAPGAVCALGKVMSGRRVKDGAILLPADQQCVGQRRRLGFAGVVSIAIALTPRGEMAGDPDVMIAGLPDRTREGAAIDALIDDAIFEAFEKSAPRQAARRRCRLERNRARGARFGQRRLGQEATSACARGGGVTQAKSIMIGKLNHVAIAVPDLEKAAQTYRETLGARVSAPKPEPAHGVTVVFVELPNTKIELLHPLGANSPIAKFLERNPDGGMHHLCYEVEDIIAARDQLNAKGAQVLGDGNPKTGAHGKPVLFLHPKDFAGTLVEIEQV